MSHGKKETASLNTFKIQQFENDFRIGPRMGKFSLLHANIALYANISIFAVGAEQGTR